MNIRKCISNAIKKRTVGHPKKALVELLALIRLFPNHPDVNYQVAWTYDVLGSEKRAVIFYEKALANKLRKDRVGAFVGLGSSYRCLRKYKRSLAVFDKALLEFPSDRSLKVFHALTLLELGRPKSAIGSLLTVLLETTKDKSIKRYGRALRAYAK